VPSARLSSSVSSRFATCVRRPRSTLNGPTRFHRAKLTDYVWSPALQVDRFTFSSGTEF
jgi:hypothetical protein